METNRRPTEAPKKEQQRTDQRSFAILMKGLLAFLNGLASDWHPLGTEWQLTKTQRFWIVRIAIVLVFLLAIGYAYDKTLWNWMQLLIVPAVLAAGGYLFARAENRRTERSARQRAQDEALQAYLGEMGSLMLEKGLGSSQANATCVPQDNSQVPTLAQARTLTVVRMLGPGGKRSVLDFLYESKLIGGSGPAIVKLGGSDSHGGAADLSCADLEADHLPEAKLSGAILTGANLSKANLSEADLSRAYLNDADLSRANLRNANLRHADLSMATLTSADLTDTDLTGADLSWGADKATDLSEADLREANLRGANLRKANLSGADLCRVNLRGTRGWTDHQLSAAKSLEGATMPDGQILRGKNTPNGPFFEEWLKDRADRKEE